jgi:three-Cys-motif partner protein
MPREDDRLITPDVGVWNEQKYKLVAYYASIFASSMKNKWNCRTYIDLFAGSGRSRLRESGDIVDSSAILSLRIDNPFDKYIFCDIDHEKIYSLRTRVEREFPGAPVEYIVGDINISIDAIKAAIPQHDADHKVLSFCFADPYNLGNLCFPTIRSLSEKFIDFLVLIATDMDANRNEETYTQADNEAIQYFLDNKDWRDDWEKAKGKGQKFGLFIFNSFSKQMETLNYKPFEAKDSLLVRNYQKNAPLYRLALYSRHTLGGPFFKKAKKYVDPQIDLFE